MVKQRRKALERELEVARLYMQHHASRCAFALAEQWMNRVKLLESMLGTTSSEKGVNHEQHSHTA